MNANKTKEEVDSIATKVKCPICSNKRLLDMVSATDAEVIIKCPKCKNIIDVKFKDNRIKTTRA